MTTGNEYVIAIELVVCQCSNSRFETSYNIQLEVVYRPSSHSPDSLPSVNGNVRGCCAVVDRFVVEQAQFLGSSARL